MLLRVDARGPAAHQMVGAGAAGWSAGGHAGGGAVVDQAGVAIDFGIIHQGVSADVANLHRSFSLGVVTVLCITV